MGKKHLYGLKESVAKGQDITKEAVMEMTIPEGLGDDEMMGPVDMRGVGKDFDDVEQMVEELGAKGAAEAFQKAYEYFNANKDKEPEDERPKPMTAKEWRDVLEDGQMGEGEEEGLLMEGEEEDFMGQEDGEEEGDDEPAAKKAKTN